jgi:hypothetical protein
MKQPTIEKYPKMGDVIKSDKLLFEGPDEWIVVEARWNNKKSSIHEGWYLVVQQLNEDGTYNEKGFTHSFFMTGEYPNMIPPKNIKIIRQMKRTFI